MADIFLARAKTNLGGARLVVVKQIRANVGGNEQFSEMLIAEAKLAARLNHANVVQVFDLGRHEDVLFIAMEYVEGLDLNELLRRCARSHVPLPIDFALLIVMEALQGLGYAHRLCDEKTESLGIVHRDVSPSNVLISFEGEVKLCDFGIARANDMADLLPDDVIKGKAGYMSPEQARGESLDARADVFATGIILWELLAGRKLYRAQPEGPSLLELARAAQIPPVPERGLPMEDQLHGIIAKALSPDPAARYASAQAMLRDLETYVGKAHLAASPIRFGSWLREHFAENLITMRRSRERAAKALEKGPAAIIEPIDPPPPVSASAPKIASASQSQISQPDPSLPPAARLPDSVHDTPLPANHSSAHPVRSAAGTFLVYALVGIGLGLIVIAILWFTR